MAELKLLPCPFCGSEAIAEREGSPSYWVAMCAGKDCAIEPISGPCSSREAAIAAWNTRPAPALTPAQQAAEEMARALGEAKEFIENQQLPDAEWSRVLDVVVAALAKAVQP